MKRKKVTNKQPATSAKSSQPAAGTSEPSSIVTVWAKARKRMKHALRSAGRDPAEAAAIVARMMAARQGKAADELAVYDEIKPVYVGLVQDGREEFESDLVALCAEKALVHLRAEDAAGAIREYDQVITIQERWVKQHSHPHLAAGLAKSYIDKAIAISIAGDNQGAAALYDQAIAILESLVHKEGRREMLNDLACAYNGRGAMVRLDNHSDAIALYDQAIEVWERLVRKDGRLEFGSNLAMAYSNKAAVLGDLNDDRVRSGSTIR